MRYKDYLVLSGLAHVTLRVLIRGWQKVRGERRCSTVDLKMKEEARAKECRQPLEARKGKETNSPIEPSEET